MVVGLLLCTCCSSHNYDMELNDSVIHSRKGEGPGITQPLNKLPVSYNPRMEVADTDETEPPGHGPWP